MSQLSARLASQPSSLGYSHLVSPARCRWQALLAGTRDRCMVTAPPTDATMVTVAAGVTGVAIVMMSTASLTHVDMGYGHGWYHRCGHSYEYSSCRYGLWSRLVPQVCIPLCPVASMPHEAHLHVHRPPHHHCPTRCWVSRQYCQGQYTHQDHMLG